jgi:hypothetical protein
MRSPFRRFGALARLATVTLVALAFASPVAAQFGGLKKKLKAKAGREGVSKAAAAASIAPDEAAQPGAPAEGGGIVVLTEDVVSQLIAGLKAGEAIRTSAAKEDTPYGRTRRAQMAYAAAKPKCEAANETFIARVSENPKLGEKYQAAMDKMTSAMQKGDEKAVATYHHQASAMIDASCTVTEPKEPESSFYQTQREVDARADAEELKASGLSRRDLPVLKERTVGILEGASLAGGASAGEKSAVAARSAELKALLGIREAPHVEAVKRAPKPAPAPAAAQPTPAMPAGAVDMSACMMKNMEKHEAEIEALEKRAEAAQNVGDQKKIMALADTLNRLQMGGCR